jgi:hypothetical protein
MEHERVTSAKRLNWSKHFRHIPILAPILNIVSERIVRAIQSERAGAVLPIDERQGYCSEKPIQSTWHLGIARGHCGMMAKRLSMRSTRLAREGSNEKRRVTILVAEIVGCIP